MLYAKRACTALLVLMSVCFTATISAQPFQIQVDASQSQSTIIDDPGGESESDSQQFQLKYYLQPVIAANGPLGEKVFLSKSGFLAGSYGKVKLGQGFSTDTRALRARFITQTHTVYGLSYETEDTDGSENKDESFELGKYLGNRGLALLTYSKAERLIESTTWTLSYRQLLDGATPGRYLAYEIGLDYIDNDVDSGYKMTLHNTQYLSSSLSVGVSVSYLDVGDVNTSSVLLSGEYFFTENFSGEVGASRTNNSGTQDIETLNLTIRARF